MERIVQLKESEYERLVQLANINEKSINQMAYNIWLTKGVARVDVDIKTNTDHTDRYSIKCDAWVFYKDDRFEIPHELRERLSTIVTNHLEDKITKQFGGLVNAINNMISKSESLTRTKYIMWSIAAAGWGAFALYLFFMINN